MTTRRRLLAAGLLWLTTRRALAQSESEVIQDTAEYQGHKADAPIEKESRQQNTGGSDRAGLCVIASCVMILNDTGDHDIAKFLWETARSRPGGYHPQKLEGLFQEAKKAFPGRTFEWEFCTDSNWEAFARKWTEKGYSVGMTFAYGDRYPGKIAHMVVMENLGSTGGWGLACDNNFVDGSVTGDHRGPRSWIAIEDLRKRVEEMGGPWILAIKTANHPRRGSGSSGGDLSELLPVLPLAALAVTSVAAAAILNPDQFPEQEEAA